MPQFLINFLPLFVIATVFLAAYFFLQSRAPGNAVYGSAVALGLLTGFFTVWVSLGVGIFGESDGWETLSILVTLAVGSGVAIIARFQPDGMSRALVAAALCQVLTALVSLLTGTRFELREMVFNAVFVAMYLGSAFLFRRDAQRSNQPDQQSR